MKIIKLFLTILIFFLLTLPAFAAWTVTASQCAGGPYPFGNDMVYCYQISATSDANASGDQTLSTLLETAYGAQDASRMMRQLAGTVLFWVDYIPDGTATPTTATTITIDKETAALVFNQTVATAGTAQSWPGNATMGSLVPLTDATVAMTTLANEKIAVIKLWFYGGGK